MTYEFQGRTQARAEADGRRGGAARPPRSGEGQEPRQPIHGFAGLMGLLFVLAGIAGFIPGVTSHYGALKFAGPDSGAKLAGLFQVSVLHNIVHLVFGGGLIAAARASWSRIYLLGGGVASLGLALFGVLVDHDSDGNFLPINDADTILYVVLGAAMIALGVLGTRLWRSRAAAPPAPDGA